jgi:hypothetical protein
MLKMFWTSLAIVCFALTAWSQESTQPAFLSHRIEASVPPGLDKSLPANLTVPAQTEVSIQILSAMHTQVSRVNDIVTAKLIQPVYINGQVALPLGSLLDGRITLIRPSGRLHRSAELGLEFDKITLPDGQAKPIAGVLVAMENLETPGLHLDADGHVHGGRAFRWKSVLGGAVGLGALGTVGAALAGPATVAALAPFGGAVALGYAALWPRGREVNLPPDTRFLVRFKQPLTVRIPW